MRILGGLGRHLLGHTTGNVPLMKNRATATHSAQQKTIDALNMKKAEANTANGCLIKKFWIWMFIKKSIKGLFQGIALWTG